MRGNTFKAATNDSPDYLRAKKSMKTTFQTVLDLRPHPRLFTWTSVSNIPMGELATAMDKLKENVSKLQPPPSSDEISDLKQACTTFRDALRQFHTVQTSLLAVQINLFISSSALSMSKCFASAVVSSRAAQYRY
jgi:hypothetical protein